MIREIKNKYLRRIAIVLFISLMPIWWIWLSLLNSIDFTAQIFRGIKEVW